jgi:putative ABC transport system permease protein
MADEKQRTRFRFWLWLIRVVGVIVPRRLRPDWLREWEAELRHREELLTQWYRLGWRNRFDLLWRSTSAFWDALWLQPKRLEDEMFQDLRFGMRMLIKHKGFTAVAVLTLALGIGANTAMFSLMDAVLLKMLPVKQPERLYVLAKAGPRGVGVEFSYLLFSRLHDETRVFEGILATSGVSRAKIRVEGGTGGQIEFAAKEGTSGNYFSTLGVPAILGRTFTADDDENSGAQSVAVISYGFWRRRFALDPSVVGRTITLDETPCTIIGVTPPEFFGVEVGSAVDVWLPLTQVTTRSFLNDPGGHWLRVIARLKPGVTEQQASADSMRIFQLDIFERAKSIKDPQWQRAELARTITLEPAGNGLSRLRQQFSQPLRILTVIVALLLLIGCANIANLLLARAEARQREIAVRLALGASRIRLLRQLLTESLLLVFIGGGLGLFFSLWGRYLLLRMIPSGNVPLSLGPVLNIRMLVFTTTISLAAGILFGLAPALRAMREDLIPAIKEATHTMTGGRHRFRLADVLVVAQVALSLVLLIGAGLVVRSLQSLQNLDAGFERKNVLTFSLDLPRGYVAARELELSRRILDRIKTLPGVHRASFSFPAPYLRGRYTTTFAVEGYTPRPGDDMVLDCLRVMPDFFESLGITLLQGRTFTSQDDASAPKVAIINESMARYFFPQQNPLGKRLGNMGRDPGSGLSLEIIGVVKDARYRGLRGAAPRIVYVPTLQTADPGVESFIVSAKRNPAQLTAALQREIRVIDPDVALRDVKTLEERVDDSIYQERIVAKLASIFGLLALALTCLGLYGVLAYAVGRRTPEIGIRVALGATPRDVLKLIVGQGLMLTMIGIGVGLAAAIGVTRLLRGFLFSISPTDSLTFVSITLLLAVTGLVACYLPARRAAKVDPLLALRHE